MDKSKNFLPVPKVITFALVILCAFLLCQASLQNKKTADDIGVFIKGWGDKVLSAVSEKFDELTDFDALSQIIDATIEEDCFLEECPPGSILQQNPDFPPETNGCGSFGVHWKKELLPDEGLEDCCNTHDICYDTCGTDRDLCDFEFKSCLYSICKGHTEWKTNEVKACKSIAKVMYTATQAFGCKAYLDGQKKSCICVRVNEEL